MTNPLAPTGGRQTPTWAWLTLDLDAGTADVAVVGQVDAGDTGSVFSYATDLLTVDVPINRIRGADGP